MIRLVILALWVFLPLAFGTAHTWAYSTVELSVWVLVGLSAVRSLACLGYPDLAWRERRRFRRDVGLYALLGLGLALVAAQLVPLPAVLLEDLSPKAAELHRLARESIQGPGEGWWAPISLYPHATRVEWLRLFTYCAFFMLILRHFRHKAQLQRLLIVWAVVASMEGLYGLLQVLAHSGQIWSWSPAYYKGGTGTFIYRNHFGAYLAASTLVALGWLVALFAAYAPIGTRPTWRARLAYLGREKQLPAFFFLFFAILIMASSLMVSASRGAILAFFFTLAIAQILLIIRRKAKRSLTLILGLVFAGVIVVFSIYIGMQSTVERFTTLGVSWPKRWDLAVGAWRLASGFPLTGSGWGSFEQVFPPYQPFWVVGKIVDHAHNDWLEILAETGWMGLALVAVATIFFWRRVALLWKQQKHSNFKWVAAGCLAAAVCLAIHALADFPFRTPAVALAWVGSLALAWQIIHRHVRSGKSAASSKRYSGRRGGSYHWLKWPVVIVGAVLYGWVGWAVISHWSAQAIARTERDSTAAELPSSQPSSLLRALALESDNADYWHRLAVSVSRLDKGPELNKLREEVSQLLDDSRLKRRSARSLARRLEEEAILRSPSQAKYYARYAWLRFSRKKMIPEVERLFAAAVRLDPRGAKWYYQWGLACLLTGQEDQAAKLFRRAVELNPAYRSKIEKARERYIARE